MLLDWLRSAVARPGNGSRKWHCQHRQRRTATCAPRDADLAKALLRRESQSFRRRLYIDERIERGRQRIKFGLVLRPIHWHRMVEIGVAAVISPILSVEPVKAQPAKGGTMRNQGHRL